jgi:hypothetical protein
MESLLDAPGVAIMVIAVHAFGVVALALRVRGNVRYERARARTIVSLAANLPVGGRVDEHRPDETRLTVSVAVPQTGQTNHG